MQCYQHTRLGQINNRISQLGGLASLVLWVSLAVWLAVSGFTSGRVVAFAGAGCLSLYTFVFGSVISLAIFNRHPEVCLDAVGLSISFMFGQVRIPWDQVLALRVRHFPRSRTLVIAKRITALHYVYGLLYGYTFRPSFVIAETLENREELIAAIQQRISVMDMH